MRFGLAAALLVASVSSRADAKQHPRVAAGDTLVLLGNSQAARFEAPGYCVVLYPMVAGEAQMVSVQPEVYARSNDGRCASVIHSRFNSFLGPDPLHSRLSVGPAAVPGRLAWLDLELLESGPAAATISARVWTRLNPTETVRRRLPPLLRLSIVSTELDTASLSLLLDWYERGSELKTIFDVATRTTPISKLVMEYVVEELLVEGIRWTLKHPPPATFSVYDPACGRTSSISFDANGDATYFGPAGCQQGIRIHLFGSNASLRTR